MAYPAVFPVNQGYFPAEFTGITPAYPDYPGSPFEKHPGSE